MGHQHDSKKEVKFPEEEVKDKNVHPFFEKTDIALLSMIAPLLSTGAQRLISFFINFGNNEPTVNPLANIGELFQQLSAKQRNSLMELAPSFLSMLSSQDSKAGGSGGLNPALLSTLLTGLMTNKKED